MFGNRGFGYAGRCAVLVAVAILVLGLARLRALAAVELVSFEALVEGNRVRITWETASETDMLGFYLQRAVEEDGEFARVGELVWATGGPTGASYAQEDEDVVPGQTYFYRLEALETTGKVDLHGPISVTVPGDGTATATHSPTPEPTSDGPPTPTTTATGRPPVLSTPTPASSPTTAVPRATSATAPTEGTTATATQRPTGQPTPTPSGAPGEAGTATLEPTTAAQPSLSPSRELPAVSTARSTPEADGSATTTPPSEPTGSETAGERAQITASRPGGSSQRTAEASGSQPTARPSGAGEAEGGPRRWLALAIVLAVLGSGLILWAGLKLMRGQAWR